MLYQLNYWRVNDKRLAGLFVHRMTTAPGAILLDLHTIRHGCLVLGRRVIATLALGACKGDESTHELITSNNRPVRARWNTIASALLFCQRFFAYREVSADSLHNLMLSTGVRRPRERHGATEKNPAPPKRSRAWDQRIRGARLGESYSMMVLTTPEPTVWPPSRMAKRRPSSMAIG